MINLILSGISAGFDLMGIPLEFILFGATLLCVAIFHDHTLKVALTGLTAILIYKLAFTGFSLPEHIFGNEHHEGEWSILLNLFGLLTGFAILADHFEKSGMPEKLPHYLPPISSQKRFARCMLMNLLVHYL